MYQPNPPLPPKDSLPTMYDLPSEDPNEPGVPDEFHVSQPQLLRETFQPPNYPLDEVFVGSDINLYYDGRHPLWYKRPDWFAAVGVCRSTQQQDLRLSYVIWQEVVTPLVVVELLSPGTEAEDLGQTLRDVEKPPTKWEVYERMLRVPYYVVFDRYTHRFRAFSLMPTRYQELELPENKLWIEDIQLGLGLWQGSYQGVEGLWLRWYTANGEWVPTEAERTEQERQRTEQERQRTEQEYQRAEQERQRADRLADRLRALGIDPEDV
jgi:Uma2 family endonuclease